MKIDNLKKLLVPLLTLILAGCSSPELQLPDVPLKDRIETPEQTDDSLVIEVEQLHPHWRLLKEAVTSCEIEQLRRLGEMPHTRAVINQTYQYAQHGQVGRSYTLLNQSFSLCLEGSLILLDFGADPLAQEMFAGDGWTRHVLVNWNQIVAVAVQPQAPKKNTYQRVLEKMLEIGHGVPTTPLEEGYSRQGYNVVNTFHRLAVTCVSGRDAWYAVLVEEMVRMSPEDRIERKLNERGVLGPSGRLRGKPSEIIDEHECPKTYSLLVGDRTP